MENQKTVLHGLVLRETDTKETDKILTVLTAELGKIPVIARGARRKNSRIAAVSQLLTYGELTVFHRGNWYILDDGETRELFQGVRQDLELLSLAAYFAELTEALTTENRESGQLLPLLLNALYALGTLHKDPQLVKAAFELRILALCGFEPLCRGCAVCGAQEPREPMLDVVRGMVHCRSCKEPGGLSMPLPGDTLTALRHILECPPKRLYSFTLPQPQLHSLGNAAEAFVAAQLERSFRTLDYYRSIRLPDEPGYGK